MPALDAGEEGEVLGVRVSGPADDEVLVVEVVVDEGEHAVLPDVVADATASVGWWEAVGVADPSLGDGDVAPVCEVAEEVEYFGVGVFGADD